MAGSVIAHIDLDALYHNFLVLKQAAPQCKILAMVKNNAYGHGATKVSKLLQPYTDSFGVARYEEALTLQRAGINKPIVVWKGFCRSNELKIISKHQFCTTIYNFEQIEILKKTKLMHPIVVWLKVDTGMHRLGFQTNQVASAYKMLMENANVCKPLFIASHFSDADSKDQTKTNLQITKFEKVLTGLNGFRSLPNSAAILKNPRSYSGWARPGLALYGVSPFENKCGKDLGLKQVMTLTSEIISIFELKKGDTIGYSSTWTCPEDMRVGVLSIGYGDGYPWSAKTGTPILINGIICPLVGRVSMDLMSVDLRKLPNAKIGDKTILWGKELPIEQIAKSSNTCSYELLCRVTKRAKRKYYDCIVSGKE